MDDVCQDFAMQPTPSCSGFYNRFYSFCSALHRCLFLTFSLSLCLSHSVPLTISSYIAIYLSPSLIMHFCLSNSLSLSLSLSLSISNFCRFSTEKVPKIDRLLGKYKGREEEFLRFVYQKYGNKIIFLFLIIFIAACLFAIFCYTMMPLKSTPALSLIYYCLSYHHLFFFFFFLPSFPFSIPPSFPPSPDSRHFIAIEQSLFSTSIGLRRGR